MNQVVINSTTIGIVISVLGYELGMLLKENLSLPFLTHYLFLLFL